jgi:hypothetical protein
VVIIEADVALETDFPQLGHPLLHLFVNHLELLSATEQIGSHCLQKRFLIELDNVHSSDSIVVRVLFHNDELLS